jgi:hypothetical protein
MKGRPDPTPARRSLSGTFPHCNCTMTNQLRRAYYSPSFAKLYGSSIYRGADGSEIEVTCVERESTGIYKWQDQVPVGPVIEWIRKGQTGSNPLPRLQ